MATAQEAQVSQTKLLLPKNYEAILEDADSQIDKSSSDRLYEQLYSGIFLNQKKKPILTGCPGLEDFKLQESHRFGIEEAILQESESFEVKGRFNTCNLTPQTFYKVSFIIRMEKNAHGWEDPVNLRLVHPDGREEERKEKLKGKPENKWMEILVGTFTTFIDAGEIEFSMYEFGKRKKKGLAIFAAFIQPLPFRNN
ncbi:protein PHLOEM PROTEIN 2-LIKE A1-like isoform X2 [Pistacia vera]|uniref:protein PHLOEM PROTEIN 2-LIKE A1-like isoform X2 n=1 Tax=Pistacia vera TaxID=55513 RepID=UPI001263C49E|nr:protein PHLOEM PROTEIN 2-LIKE A1-like isoform X2 [Pistacia vera]XP_031260935.1 protein PHLOEM PROTEIN 2-LIKE A1-like isoform X2 [Pistacia vera]